MFDTSAQFGHHRSTATSLAAVFHVPQQPLELRRLALPTNLAAGEAIVRVTCCTLCGSDLSTLAGHRQEPTPCILGHEILGVVHELGPGKIVDLRGRIVRIGDRVVWSVATSCDRCRYCLRGMPQKCVHLKKYGHSRLADNWQLSGGLAEHCHLIAGTKLLVVEASLDDAVLTPASCATSTVAAALRRAGDLPGARVLILGAGLLGLTACAMAKSWGADSVTICDLTEERIALAHRFGADRGWLWADFAQVAEPTFDIVLEMSGNVAAIRAALSVADIGANIVLVGSVRPTPAIEILPEQLVRRLWSLHGVHNYCPQDLVVAVDFLQSQADKFPFAEVVSESYSLEQINVAIASTSSKPPIRIAIRP